MWVVIWYTYGNWKVTHGFNSEIEAERHADLYLRGKGNEHKTHVEVRFLPLPVKP